MLADRLLVSFVGQVLSECVCRPRQEILNGNWKFPGAQPSSSTCRLSAWNISSWPTAAPDVCDGTSVSWDAPTPHSKAHTLVYRLNVALETYNAAPAEYLGQAASVYAVRR